MKIVRTLFAGVALTCLFVGWSVSAGIVNPDCTPAKAAKSAAAKSTVGVGGRCKPGETVKDTTKRAVGADDKRNGDGVAEKAADKVKKD